MIASIYEQMLALVGPDAPPGPRKAFLEELNTGVGSEEPLDFFHVAIDLPGHGASKAKPQASKRRADGPLVKAELLADVIKSLGKHYAFLVIAAADGAAAVLDALSELPNMCSFLCLREPKVNDMEGLHGIFQPALLAVEARGKQALLAARMSEALLYATTTEWSRSRQAKHPDRELSADILTFLRQRRWRGHLPGHGHSKKAPLLTKLVGGMLMWKGERQYTEPDKPLLSTAQVEDEAEASAEVAQLEAVGREGTATVVQFAHLDGQ